MIIRTTLLMAVWMTLAISVAVGQEKQPNFNLGQLRHQDFEYKDFGFPTQPLGQHRESFNRVRENQLDAWQLLREARTEDTQRINELLMELRSHFEAGDTEEDAVVRKLMTQLSDELKIQYKQFIEQSQKRLPSGRLLLPKKKMALLTASMDEFVEARIDLMLYYVRSEEVPSMVADSFEELCQRLGVVVDDSGIAEMISVERANIHSWKNLKNFNSRRLRLRDKPARRRENRQNDF